MFYGHSVVDQVLDGVNTDFQMLLNIIFGNGDIANISFHTFGNHRRIGNKQQSACWNFIRECNCKDGSGFHINGLRSNLSQVFFERLIPFPHPSVGGINSTRPVILIIIPNGC